jgi:hypothetical protein
VDKLCCRDNSGIAWKPSIKYDIDMNTKHCLVPNLQVFLSFTINICSKVLDYALLIGGHHNSSHYANGMKGFGGLAIRGRHCRFRILFLAFISSASMNPARFLAPDSLSGLFGNLRILDITFVVTSIIVFF